MFDFKFDWCKEMECGVQIIDEQHKELFRIGRNMEQLIMNDCKNASKKQLLDIVCELREYVAYHFYTEEDLMHKYNFPDNIKHTASHISFKVHILEIDIPTLEKNPTKVLTQLKESLQTFLFSHILVEDLSLCKYLNTCGIY